MAKSTINSARVVKTSVVWMTIVYVLCFVVVSMWPGIMGSGMMSSFHAQFNMGPAVMTGSSFVYGLILWDILAAFGAWLFVALYNNFEK